MNGPVATAARERLGRKGQAALHLPEDRDALGVLEGQHASRLGELVPVRIGRMMQSPFAFYRGGAAVMAADLRDAPTSGIDVVLCGDAHLSNFGFYASPERELVFDLNDFDEAGIGPWEWDVKRLAASVHVGGRDVGLSEDGCRDAVVQAVESYRTVLREFVQLTATERYFYRVDSSEAAARLGRVGRRTVRRAADKARTRTSDQVLRKVTTRTGSGGLCIDEQPPVLRHVDHASRAEMGEVLDQYRTTLREDVAFLLAQFRPVDFALRVVGVGSVGTRCYLIAMEGPAGEVLFLQAKEAQASVLTSHGGRQAVVPGHEGGRPHTEGHRVVAGQRILQATSDPFLGWIQGWAGDSPDRPRVDYYLRQFRDMKGSIDPSTLGPAEFGAYGALCAALLARAHGQSPGGPSVAAYLGRSGRFAEATAGWAACYADVAERDYEQVCAAVAAGRLPAEHGV